MRILRERDLLGDALFVWAGNLTGNRAENLAENGQMTACESPAAVRKSARAPALPATQKEITLKEIFSADLRHKANDISI